MPLSFSEKVLSWFYQYGRHTLPWQNDPTPYRVWISEVMLQQTQVNTVLTYFQRFVAHFPTIQHLATARLDDVLSLWSGLGYYSRARNLHQSANIIVTQYHGKWPMDVTTLTTLPGIGRSTAGAIISLSNNHFAPILDGNVKRVLARFFAIEQWPGETSTQKMLWTKAESLTSNTHPKDYNQAMMDLGAMICTRTQPQCPICPLHHDCQAFQQNATNHYPVKKSKKTVPVIHKQFILLMSSVHDIWMYKRPPNGIWGGLWSLPELSMETSPQDWLMQWLADQTYPDQIKTSFTQTALPAIKHVFTHFVLHLHPVKITISHAINQHNDGIWHDLRTPFPGGVSAAIMKVLKQDTTRYLAE